MARSNLEKAIIELNIDRSSRSRWQTVAGECIRSSKLGEPDLFTIVKEHWVPGKSLTQRLYFERSKDFILGEKHSVLLTMRFSTPPRIGFSAEITVFPMLQGHRLSPVLDRKKTQFQLTLHYPLKGSASWELLGWTLDEFGEWDRFDGVWPPQAEQPAKNN